MSQALSNPDLARHLRDFIAETGRNPTASESASALGIASNNIARNLRALEKSGHLDRSTDPWTLPQITLNILDAMDGKTATPTQAGETNQALRHLPLTAILPSSFNPRRTFKGIRELAASIASDDLLMPLLVRPHPASAGHWEIVAGERRFRALNFLFASEAEVFRDFCKEYEIPKGKVAKYRNTRRLDVPCHVRELSETEAIAAAITENLDREDVDPLEQADGFVAWLARAEANGETATTKALAEKLGKTPRYIQQWVRLARDASDRLKQAYRDNLISFELARTLTAHDQPVQDYVVSLAEQKKLITPPARLIESLRAMAVPVSRACFPLEDYDGPFLRDAGKPTHFFDYGKFMTAQQAYCAALAEQGWQKVAVMPDQIGQAVTRAEEDEATDLLCFTINHNTGEVEQARFIKLPDAPEQEQEQEQEEEETAPDTDPQLSAEPETSPSQSDLEDFTETAAARDILLHGGNVPPAPKNETGPAREWHNVPTPYLNTPDTSAAQAQPLERNAKNSGEQTAEPADMTPEIYDSIPAGKLSESQRPSDQQTTLATAQAQPPEPKAKNSGEQTGINAEMIMFDAIDKAEEAFTKALETSLPDASEADRRDLRNAFNQGITALTAHLRAADFLTLQQETA